MQTVYLKNQKFRLILLAEVSQNSGGMFTRIVTYKFRDIWCACVFISEGLPIDMWDAERNVSLKHGQS